MKGLKFAGKVILAPFQVVLFPARQLARLTALL
jgi:hypothetical protein